MFIYVKFLLLDLFVLLVFVCDSLKLLFFDFSLVVNKALFTFLSNNLLFDLFSILSVIFISFSLILLLLSELQSINFSLQSNLFLYILIIQ